MSEIDWSQAPEGATHYLEDWHCTSTGGIQYYKLDRVGWLYWGENIKKGWVECDHPIQGYKEVPMTTQPPAAAPTPTLETMLTEWRDLEARAQAAQAEADALFEHAGQCHGEIVVRLAELGWGAPRGPMVPGEPAVTFDKGGWIDWKGGECPVTDGTIIDTKYRNGDLLTNGECGTFGTKTSREFWKHENHHRDIIAYRLTPSAQQ